MLEQNQKELLWLGYSIEGRFVFQKVARLIIEGGLWLILETRHVISRDFGHPLNSMEFIVFLVHFPITVDIPRFKTIYLNFACASTEITHFSAPTILHYGLHSLSL